MNKQGLLSTTAMLAMFYTSILLADNNWTPTLTVTPQSGNAPLNITVRTDIQETITYKITTITGSGGTISPTSDTVTYGSTARFTVLPQEGYGIKSISGCNGTLNGTTYTTGKVISDCSVNVDFASTDGKLITTIQSNARGYNVEIQSDGKIVVFGNVLGVPFSGGGTNHDFLIVRYNIDGSIDKTFGNGGWRITDFGSNDIARGMSIQSDGKILATGSTDQGSKMALVRYNSDGSIDTTFGSNGIIETNDTGIPSQSGNIGFTGRDVTYQEDGKVLVVGTSSTSWGSYYWTYMTLARYTYDGVLDATFGNDGFMNTDRMSGNATTINPDGKILIAGSIANSGFVLARINGNGSFDDSFENGGIAITAIGSGGGASRVNLQIDGKIILAGTIDNGLDYDFALVRYNSDGSLDGEFGNSGIVSVGVKPGSSDGLAGVALQADGKIIMAGRSDGNIALVRYHTDGTLDESFGIYGFVTTDILDEKDRASDITVQQDGKIVVVGSCTEGIVLLRYNSDGTLDKNFDGNAIK